jgi:hypothetical protein
MAAATACTPDATNEPREGLAMETNNALIGHWTRQAAEACAESYPDSLEFRDGGVYHGSAGDGQGFVQWGGGDYRLLDDRRIKLQDQRDAMVEYRFTLDGRTLSFLAPDGCRILYTRMAE